MSRLDRKGDITIQASALPGRGAGKPGGSTSQLGPLLPELAKLQWLEELEVTYDRSLILGPVPAGWGQPGAFPRLRK
jgi:hypothetical protein